MNHVRRRLLSLFVLCSFAPFAFAQDAVDSTGNGNQTSFGGPGPGSPGGSEVNNTYGTQLSGPGSGSQGGSMEAESPSVGPTGISLPVGYGFLPQTLTQGEGRFAQPPYRVSLSFSQGYDDNIYTAPDRPERLPFPDGRIVTRPKVGSWVNYGSLGVQIRLASPVSVFTLDANIGGTAYWHRSEQQFEYNDDIALSYAHKISPRMQFDAEANFVLAPQPDFGNFNAPNSQGDSGEYFVGTIKFDLSYQWTPKFQTVTTYSFNTLVYTESAFGSGDYYQNTIGNQFRFLVNPRVVAVGEYRFSSVATDSSANSSESNFLLAGFDYTFSRRLSATLRAGAELRSYQSDDFETSPFVETTLQYVYGHNSTLVWTNRYGFEPSGLNQTRQTSYRTSLNVNQVITGRIVAHLGFNYDRFDTDNVGNNRNGDDEDDFNLNVGATYALNKNFGLNAYYTFTDVLSSLEFTSYTRNRIFFGATYSF